MTSRRSDAADSGSSTAAPRPMLDRVVAVKVLSTDLDPDNLDRFLREQRAMGRLSGHPHIMNILQVGVLASGRPFIVMPYHAKDSLEALIRRHGPLDWCETLQHRREARGRAGRRALARAPCIVT